MHTRPVNALCVGGVVEDLAGLSSAVRDANERVAAAEAPLMQRSAVVAAPHLYGCTVLANVSALASVMYAFILICVLILVFICILPWYCTVSKTA